MIVDGADDVLERVPLRRCVLSRCEDDRGDPFTWKLVGRIEDARYRDTVTYVLACVVAGERRRLVLIRTFVTEGEQRRSVLRFRLEEATELARAIAVAVRELEGSV